MLAKSTDSDMLSNRVVHVSVQLFSNEDLAYEMTKNHDLLRIMIKSLHSMMVKIAQNSILQRKIPFCKLLLSSGFFDGNNLLKNLELLITACLFRIS